MGHKWLERFDAGGRAGLSDRSRAPAHCPHRIADDVAALICLARRQHPSWGPRDCCNGWNRGIRTSCCLPSARPVIARPQGPREETPPPAAAPASRHRARRDDTAERPVDRGLQWPVSHLRWHLLLSADDRRRAHAILDGVPRSAIDENHGVRPVFDQLCREYRLPHAIPHGQPRAVRHEWESRLS